MEEKKEDGDVERCSYVLPKKNRKCRMLVKAGSLFCGEHANQEAGNRDRVACPLNPRHTVLLKELEKHVQSRCNERFVATQPYLREKMNAVDGETRYFDSIDRRPNEEELRSVTDVLLKNEKSIQEALSANTVGHVELTAAMLKYMEQNRNLSVQKIKHMKQIAAMIAQMKSAKLLREEATTCLCDLGAGKAQLAYWTAKTAPSVRYLLVDRQGMRLKWDNRAKKEGCTFDMVRLRCSVEHLDLRKVQELQGIDDVFGVCKHLCGSGTDAGIRCMLRLLEEDEGEQEKEKGSSVGVKKPRLSGLVLAPCCAHKSRFVEYIGSEHLESLGLSTPADFSALRHIATWAVAGMAERNDDGEEDGTWSSQWKRRLGRLAKVLLETGRALAIQKRGFKVSVVEYVDEGTSPENLLILAIKSE